jgi:hypothetical protein
VSRSGRLRLPPEMASRDVAVCVRQLVGDVSERASGLIHSRGHGAAERVRTCPLDPCSREHAAQGLRDVVPVPGLAQLALEVGDPEHEASRPVTVGAIAQPHDQSGFFGAAYQSPTWFTP